MYFITFTVVGWVDLFIRKEYKDILLDSWKHCQKEKDLEIYAWCIMTSHVHMIVGSKGRALDKIIGKMKSFTSRRLRKSIVSNQSESRREWLLPMMKKAGLQNAFASAGDVANNVGDFEISEFKYVVGTGLQLAQASRLCTSSSTCS